MFIQYLWHFLNDISFLIILSLVSIVIPGIAQRIQTALLSIIYLDILQTDKWLIPLIYTESDEEEEDDLPLNYFFEQNGFQSKSLLKNLGSTFVYGSLMLISLFLLLLVKFSGTIFASCKSVDNIISRLLLWNTAIRFALQQFPSLFTASLINLYDFQSSTFTQIICSILSVAIVIGMHLVILILFYLIRRERKMGNTNLSPNINTLAAGLQMNSFISAYWNVIIMARWSVTLIIMVVLRDYYSQQIQLLLFISLLFQALLVHKNPMQDHWLFPIFNEAMVSIYLYTLMILAADEMPYREECGWVLVSTIFFSCAVNILKFMHSAGLSIFRRIRKCCHEQTSKESCQMTTETQLHQEGLTERKLQKLKKKKSIRGKSKDSKTERNKASKRINQEKTKKQSHTDFSNISSNFNYYQNRQFDQFEITNTNYQEDNRILAKYNEFNNRFNPVSDFRLEQINREIKSRDISDLWYPKN